MLNQIYAPPLFFCLKWSFGWGGFKNFHLQSQSIIGLRLPWKFEQNLSWLNFRLIWGPPPSFLPKIDFWLGRGIFHPQSHSGIGLRLPWKFEPNPLSLRWDIGLQYGSARLGLGPFLSFRPRGPWVSAEGWMPIKMSWFFYINLFQVNEYSSWCVCLSVKSSWYSLSEQEHTTKGMHFGDNFCKMELMNPYRVQESDIVQMW